MRRTAIGLNEVTVIRSIQPSRAIRRTSSPALPGAFATSCEPAIADTVAGPLSRPTRTRVTGSGSSTRSVAKKRAVGGEQGAATLSIPASTDIVHLLVSQTPAYD